MPTSSFVESGFWCFDALFVPQQHPARDLQDTFYLSDPSSSLPPPKAYYDRVSSMHVSGGHGSIGYRAPWSDAESHKLLLRTHTTASSAGMLYKLAARCRGEDVGEEYDWGGTAGRVERKEGLDDGFRPAKLFSVDRVFRNETMDATHLAEFHQVEGVVADRGLTLADLIGEWVCHLDGFALVRLSDACEELSPQEGVICDRVRVLAGQTTSQLARFRARRALCGHGFVRRLQGIESSGGRNLRQSKTVHGSPSQTSQLASFSFWAGVVCVALSDAFTHHCEAFSPQEGAICDIARVLTGLTSQRWRSDSLGSGSSQSSQTQCRCLILIPSSLSFPYRIKHDTNMNSNPLSLHDIPLLAVMLMRNKQTNGILDRLHARLLQQDGNNEHPLQARVQALHRGQSLPPTPLLSTFHLAFVPVLFLWILRRLGLGGRMAFVISRRECATYR